MKSVCAGLAFLHPAWLLAHHGCHMAVEAASSSTSGSLALAYPECTGFPYWIGDGDCDRYNNFIECGFDGGDCCACTCVSTEFNTCGEENGFDCKDPSVPPSCADEVSIPDSSSVYSYQLDYIDEDEYEACFMTGGYVYTIGNGACNSYNNNEECKYDGGDCCICTCEDSSQFRCGDNRGYECQDPSVSASCVEESNLFVEPSYFSYYLDYISEDEYAACRAAGGSIIEIGDGNCGLNENIEECNYDGGDCCICTCESDDESRCRGYFDCKDPSVSESCVQESLTYFPSSTYSYYMNYISEDEYLTCIRAGGDVPLIGDANCDEANNSEQCKYDGGDCCSCTCVDTDRTPCGFFWGYDCQDPTVSASCKEESDSHEVPGHYSRYTEYISEDEYDDCTSTGGVVLYIADTRCDEENNNEQCKYDGGDCCICTCEVVAFSECNGVYSGWECLDPTVSESCMEESNSYIPPHDKTYYLEYISEDEYAACNLAGGDIPDIGDGYCSLWNNKEECKYDGGDCCICTCNDTPDHTCGDKTWSCRDPSVSASCVAESVPSFGL